jgi:hypothetical protein
MSREGSSSAVITEQGIAALRRPHCLRHLACVARIIETVLRRQESIVDAHIERQSTDLRHQRRSELPYEIAHSVEGRRRQMQQATTHSTLQEIRARKPPALQAGDEAPFLSWRKGG